MENGPTWVDPIWERVDAELQHRKAKHLAPASWSALGRLIEASRQTTTNWRTRGIPPKEYVALAGALGWTIDQLVGVGQESEPDATAPADEDLAGHVAHLLQIISTTPPHQRLLAVLNAETAVWDVRNGTAQAVHALKSRSNSLPKQERQEDEGKRST